MNEYEYENVCDKERDNTEDTAKLKWIQKPLVRQMSNLETKSEAKPGMDLEGLLVGEIGQFGWFQRRLLLIVTVVAIFGGWCTAEYIFSTGRVNTRCLIPECETVGNTEFSPPWLVNAVPLTSGAFDGCRRFANRTNNINVTDYVTNNVIDDVTFGSCPAAFFDTNTTVLCDEYVFENTNTVVYDFGLACDEWRRSLIGSARYCGMLLAFPITGFVSDRWGRRTALTVNVISAACLGTARYWVNSYTGFVAAEFVEASFGSGKYTTAYILLSELVGPKYRVRTVAVAHASIAVGHMTAALLASRVHYWRHLILTLYLPQFLFIFYLFFVPESIRWYLSKGKFDKAEQAIKKVAKFNGKEISDKTLQELRENTKAQENKSEGEKEDEPWLIVQVFKHKPVLLRCLVSPLWWITSEFVSYGLSINAVNIVGNRYLNYALVAAVEIPGVLTAVLLMDRAGRRPVLMGGFWLCALCQLGYIFIPSEMISVSLLVYLLGKCSITAVDTTLHAYTTELYPTQHRHKLFAFSTTIGRIGTILAPLTPALGAASFASLPFLMFGGMALLAGLLVLVTPETLGAPLPDTMEQASNIGRDAGKTQSN